MPPNDVVASAKLPTYSREALEQIARADGVSVSEFVRRACQLYVSECFVAGEATTNE